MTSRKELRRLLDAASHLPWHMPGLGWGRTVEFKTEADLHFAIAAANATPVLLDTLDRYEEALRAILRLKHTPYAHNVARAALEPHSTPTSPGPTSEPVEGATEAPGGVS